MHLVGGAAGPLGGDDLRLSVVVGPGATLAVRGVAATLALPAVLRDRPGRLAVEADVGPGATLDWAPEPTIVAAGAWLELDVVVRAAADATVRWREELVLGRSGEEPGRLVARTRAAVGGRTVLDHEQRAGGPPGPWDGPGGLAGHRWLATDLHLSANGRIPPHYVRRMAAVRGTEARGADLELACGGWVRVATAVDRRRGAALLEGGGLDVDEAEGVGGHALVVR